MDIIKHYQVALFEKDMDALKELSGKSSVQDALDEAAKHYLMCVGAHR